jgi:methyltransferase (TIGR00027 family)
LPNLSNSMSVARLRYIQAIHEHQELRNPDRMVGQFLPLVERMRLRCIGRDELSKLRSNPFYYYLLARTRHYDQVLEEAVCQDVTQIVNVGCGSDTRAYRFGNMLRKSKVRFLECDQEGIIERKKRTGEKLRQGNDVEYLPIDLNSGCVDDLCEWLECRSGSVTLLMMEGVSPYISEGAFTGFLRSMGRILAAGSRIAYDFKLCGIDDGFGSSHSVQRPYRLPFKEEEVAAFHEAIKLRLLALESSSDLCRRVRDSCPGMAAPLFAEDALVRLVV